MTDSQEPQNSKRNEIKDNEPITDSDVWLGAQASHITHYREWRQVYLLVFVAIGALTLLGAGCCWLFAGFVNWAQR